MGGEAPAEPMRSALQERRPPIVGVALPRIQLFDSLIKIVAPADNKLQNKRRSHRQTQKICNPMKVTFA